VLYALPVATSSPPGWTTSLIAGGFALFGAGVAFTSTWLSDRRRLKRDDLRQWDKEIRDGYIRASRATQVICATRFLFTVGHQDFAGASEAAEKALHEIRSVQSEFTVIALPETNESIDYLGLTAQRYVARLRGNIRPTDLDAEIVQNARDRLLASVKGNLRIDHLPPTVGPPWWQSDHLLYMVVPALIGLILLGNWVFD